MFPAWPEGGGNLGLEQLLIHGLAVCGAAAVGVFASGLLLRLARLLLRVREIPKFIQYIVRGAGGIALGFAAFVWLFNSGGAGWFRGGSGNNPIGENGKGKETDTRPMPEPTEPTEVCVQITLLGGALVSGERYYLVGEDKEAKTFSELKQWLRERQQQEKLRSMELLIYENSVSRNHAAVRELESWARDARLTVTVSTVQRVLP